MLEEPKIKKVDKRDKQLPQNFEQLIEMYDVEKIWPYIKRTIDYINNDLEKIKVSPRESTNNERVWIQKGKNLSRISGFNTINSDMGRCIVNIKVKENTSYTISATKRRISGLEISNKWFHGVGAAKAYDKSGNLLEDFFRDNAYYLETGSKRFDFSINTPKDTEYIIVDFSNNNGDYNLNTSVTDIQVEQGLTATEYEPYIEKKILCKNDNGVFEDFYKEPNEVVISGTLPAVQTELEMSLPEDLTMNNTYILSWKIIYSDINHQQDPSWANPYLFNGKLRVYVHSEKAVGKEIRIVLKKY